MGLNKASFFFLRINHTYLVFLALYSAVCIGVTYFDDIKEYIQSKFRHEEKES